MDHRCQRLLPIILWSLLPLSLAAQMELPARVKAVYDQRDVMIPMRDGVRLFTTIFTPKENAKGPYPILFLRTPYGTDTYLISIGPSVDFEREGYIFVSQDVRGRFQSEGDFVDLRPFNPGKKDREIDEASDTYDSIDWLVRNAPGNNGRVGVWGISYLGFYATMAALSGHPALKAVSPQAPVTDWFLGDDAHHNGALCLADSFDFLAGGFLPRPGGPSRVRTARYPYPTPDGYRFFLEPGSLAAFSAKAMGTANPFWNEMFRHPDYDDFWMARTPLPHLKDVEPAVMTVGSWFDAEDVWGALHTFQAVEKQNPGHPNLLVMGPWFHAQWHFDEGSQLGEMRWGSKTSETYNASILLPFFNYHLKGKGDGNFPKAQVFETGTNRWRTFDQWPPREARRESIYFGGGALSIGQPVPSIGTDSYYSDPDKPVPYLNKITNQRPGGEHQYMVEDQRFAAARPDVLVYRSEPLKDSLTIAGPITAVLYAATTGTDADFIVKVIDVFPDDTPDPNPNPTQVRMGGYQQLLRGDVMRGRYRKSFEKPVPFITGEVDKVEFDLSDVLHTFKTGHRIMIQIQSTWFPLVDRNPQTFVNIYQAQASDYKPAWMRIFHEAGRESKISVGVLNQN